MVVDDDSKGNFRWTMDAASQLSRSLCSVLLQYLPQKFEGAATEKRGRAMETRETTLSQDGKGLSSDVLATHKSYESYNMYKA